MPFRLIRRSSWKASNFRPGKITIKNHIEKFRFFFVYLFVFVDNICLTSKNFLDISGPLSLFCTRVSKEMSPKYPLKYLFHLSLGKT